jgi:steroid 5-alpha reductase family enzyme
MAFSILALALLGAAGMAVVMTLAWWVQHRLQNAGWVDAFWTLGLGLVGVADALAPAPDLAWPSPRQILVAAVIALWSLRLGLHIVDRSRHGPEDARYAAIRREWGPSYPPKMFGLLQVQALAGALLALSFIAAARNAGPLGLTEAAAVIVFGVAWAGEALSDWQMRRFRLDPANRGGVCDTGLWSLSRHPNYFFEWLAWLVYPLFAFDPAGGYGLCLLAAVGPAIMYLLLVHVSGIPPLEKQMLASRGDAYKRYQARTRPFLPLPRYR